MKHGLPDWFPLVKKRVLPNIPYVLVFWFCIKWAKPGGWRPEVMLSNS